MKTFIYSIALTLLLSAFSTVFAQGIVLELVVAQGGSGVAPYTAEIPLTSAQYSFTNAASIGSATGGAGGGKVSFDPLVITKQVDASSTVLARNMWVGAHYGYGRISFYRTGASGARELAYRIALGTIFVTGVANSAEAGCTSGCPAVSETITMAYGQVALFNPAVSTTGYVSWDQTRNLSDVTSSIPATYITKQ